MLKPASSVVDWFSSLITVQDNTMLKRSRQDVLHGVCLITVQDNTMLKLLVCIT